MEKIELTTHSDSGCGGISAYVELVQESTSCKTKDNGEFAKGVTLVWTASDLDTCLGKEFDVLNDEIEFKLMSNDGNDYCPETLTITMSNGYAYKKEGITDWVDNGKNNHLRSAKRTSSKYSLVNADSFYANFTNTTFQKEPTYMYLTRIPSLTRT